MFGRKKKDPNAPKKVRFKTIRDAYELATKQYSFVLLRCLAVFAPLWLIGILIGAQFGRPGYAAFLTFPIAFLGAFFFFTRLASSAVKVVTQFEHFLMMRRKRWSDLLLEFRCMNFLSETMKVKYLCVNWNVA